MSERLVLLGIVIVATTGAAGLLVGRHSIFGQWMSAVVAVAASSVGLAGILCFISERPTVKYGQA